MTALLLVASVLTQALPVSATTCTTSGNNVTIAANCIFDAGTYTFTGTLTINAGVTVTAASNVGNAQVIIVSDSIDVQGTIDGNARGFSAQTGTGAATASGGGAGHGGHGGNSSGAGGGVTYGSVTDPATLGSGGRTGSCTGGAGGAAVKLVASGTVTVAGTVSANGGSVTGNCGAGAGSGGSIRIDAGTLAGAGTVTANGGGNTTNSGAGGGGGRVAVYYATDSSTLISGNKINAFAGSSPNTSSDSGGAGTVFLDDTDDLLTNGALIVDNNNLVRTGTSSTTDQVTTASQTYDGVTIRNGAKYVVPNTFTLTIPSTGTLTGGGTNQPSLTISSGGTFNPPTAGTYTFTGIDVTNNGTVNTVTNVSVDDSTYVHNGTFGATVTDVTAQNAGTFVVQTSTTFAPTNVTVQSGGAFEQRMLGTLTVTNVTVQSGGSLTHTANTTSKLYELNLSSTTIDVQFGGAVNASNKGFAAQNGTGAPSGSNDGAGYGGHGGSDSTTGGATYGSPTNPTDLGSGGRSGSCTGGAGGGAVKLVASGTLTVAGTISANGQLVSGNCGGGSGAGGSVRIDAGTLAGAGTVTANGGGNTTNAGGGGGGGRVAVYYAIDTSTLISAGNKITAYGGSRAGSEQAGGAGTVFLDDTDDSLANGTIIVDNNSVVGTGSSSTTDQVTTASQTYDSVTIRNGAFYVIPNTFTLTIPSTGTLAGGSGSVLTVNSGGIFNPPTATFNFNAVSVTNNGTISTVTDLTVTAATFTHGSTGSLSATVTALTLASSATFTHQGGSGLNLTSLSVPSGTTFNLNTENANPLGAGLATTTVAGTFRSGRLAQFAVGALTVSSGGVITHSANSTSKLFQVDLSATSIDIQSGGSVTATNLGFTAQNGTGAPSGSNDGAGYGGHGGSDSTTGGATYGSPTNPTDLGSGGRTGSCAGGTGGGAIKLAVSGALTVAGSITANGQSVSGNCGGGSGAGGSVRVDAGTLAGTGTITANGGGNTTNAGGGGGGGRIAVYYTSGNPLSYTLQAFGGSRAGSEQAGGAGTVFLKSSSQTNGDLVVDNNSVAGTGTSSTTDQVTTASQTYDNITVKGGAFYVVPNTFTLTLAIGGTLAGGGTSQASITVSSGGTLDTNQTSLTVTGVDVTNNGTVADATSLTLNDSTFVHNGNFPATLTDVTAQSAGTFVPQTTTGLSLSTVTVQSGGAFEQRMLGAITAATVTVQSGGSLTHTANTTSKLYELNLSSTTIDVQTGSTVNAASKGFAAQSGTGPGTSGNAAAGHGGHGGHAGGAGGGVTYGSPTDPTTLGSGGRNGSCAGGAGGGAVKLAASGTLTVNGTIAAGGGSVTGNCGAGAGAGGSVRIDAGTLAGAGAVTANGGGNTTNGGGGGGGGRIAVYYTTDSSTLISGNKINAYGGIRTSSDHSGGAGTVYLKAAAATNGDLIVDNNNVAGTNTSSTTDQVTTATQTYDNVTIRNGARYVVPNTFTLNLASGGVLTGTGSVAPTLTVNSGGTLGLAGTTASGTLTITNSGTLALSGSMTLSTGTFSVSGAVSGGLTNLTVDGGNFINGLTANLFSGSDLIVNSGGTYTHATTSQLNVTTVTVNSGGTITHADNSTTKTAIVNISATTFTVNAGGVVTANALGFDSSEGTGQGTDAATAGGGGYCGAGGNGSTPGAGGTTYGSSANPADLGSGGGDDTSVGGLQGGSGGGEIKIQVSGTLTVNGDITANGAAGTANEGGGGSGGTVNINAGTWAGTGTITANGGQGSPTGAGATGGGGGGAGRVFVGYGSKTYSGALASNGGAKGGTTSAATAGANCTPVEQANAPVITSVTHTPSPTATTTDVITLSGGASYSSGLLKIEIYLDGTTPAELRHTCNLSGAPTSASCQISVGTLAYGAHTTTVKAYGTDLSVGTGSENFTVAGSTLTGGPQLSRSKASATGVSFTLSFGLQASSTGTLTVTFPAGFTVTQAPSGAGSSACLSAFGSTAQTMTATKTNCTGTVVLAGGQVTNPATPGVYVITWSNDFGSGSVVITDDDQVTVSGEVDPQLTFNVGSQTAACDGTFSGSGGALGLGALTASAVASSDVSAVPHVCTRVTANAATGAVIAVRSAFGALQSASTPADQVVSSTATLVAGTTGFGLCAGSSGGDSGRDSTTPAGASPSAASPFNGSCTTSAHSVGGLTTSFQSLWTLSGPSQNAFFRLFVKAAVSPAVPAHADYQDTLTFIATGTY